MKITVVGVGYVGLSLGLLLSKENDVTLFDSDSKKIELINKRQSFLEEAAIKELLRRAKNIRATTSKELAYKGATFIILALPTNLEDHALNTSAIDAVIKDILTFNREATIIIKSTVPIGFTEYLRKKYFYHSIIFSPEFLREGLTVHDNLYPSRIIVSNESKHSELFLNLLRKVAVTKKPPYLLTRSSEAEAIKLFSNAYLAQKIAFFNELDTFAELHHLNSKKIIEGMCYDSRIGNAHNNPSFGFGGYCLPKDSKQLESHFKNISAPLMTNINNSNVSRKMHIAKMILSRNVTTIGIYRINSKTDSDNYRDSAIINIIDILKNNGREVIIFEPLIREQTILGCPVINDFTKFTTSSDLIVANRMDDQVKKYRKKVYTRDAFHKD
ncbi:nucleotide sugar dehydrogenase [Streptococcus pseudoporcinus]|uniref:UDP-glucose 6-dehydrogenase n=1 Tax=Streptococcus pseudoporcinus TaxID=361101 RepID=A0A4U9XM08_9STRE|nr:nucleotide sugar dehydrogenase [Streptococcus pseudoporcinus]VTS14076.1 UDP-glucose 6-dehydrogenase [Streptococcus pseudoporcinus]VUC66992.1 UDP-glucose 6-dehydrogenase [Streptococcus pseudoporcinus]VUC97920.1 UDP-glucose 6-dehydrogenase [Streptococcus pseudoporcinus]VUC98312.1 UDP-glucose 6-dehydrogenase [Streptococcus pseudoporcinus]